AQYGANHQDCARRTMLLPLAFEPIRVALDILALSFHQDRNKVTRLVEIAVSGYSSICHRFGEISRYDAQLLIHLPFLMSPPAKDEPNTLHFFVDEAGDPCLFDAKGRLLVGQEGCSTYFILGKLEVTAPLVLQQSLNELRSHLLADPYFKR